MPPHYPLSLLHKKKLGTNLISGVAIAGMMIGIYAYTIAKMSGNDFSNVDDKGNIKQ